MWVPVVGAGVMAIGPLTLPVAAAGAAPVPSAAVPVAACTTKTGVLVAVDFRFWDQPVERGCAPTPTTGYTALHTAGFTTAGDAHDGDAFVCRIDDRPSPGEDGCQSTPLPPDSWSYWHAVSGSATWSYSQLGATFYHPPPGSIDAWVFGNTDPPTFTPAEVRSGTTPAPTTTTSSTSTTTATTSTTVATTTTTTTTAGPPTTDVADPTTTTTFPATASTTSEPAHTRRAAATHRRARPRGRRASRGRLVRRAAHSPDSTTTAPRASSSSSSPTTALRIVNAAAGVAPAKPSGSNPLGLEVGLGCAAVLGGAGAATAWRRRRAAG